MRVCPNLAIHVGDCRTDVSKRHEDFSGNAESLPIRTITWLDSSFRTDNFLHLGCAKPRNISGTVLVQDVLSLTISISKWVAEQSFQSTYAFCVLSMYISMLGVPMILAVVIS